MSFRLQTRKDRLLEQLKGIANTVHVNDVNVEVAPIKKKQDLEESGAESEAPRVTNKFEIARKLPDEPAEMEAEEDDTEYFNAKNVKRHVADYKIKGKFEKFIVKQNIRRWRDIAQNITHGIQQKEDEQKKEIGVSGFKIMKEDVWRVIKRFVNGQQEGSSSGVMDERKTYRKNVIDHVGNEDHCRKVTQKKEKDLKRLLPLCNNVILTKVQKAKV